MNISSIKPRSILVGVLAFAILVLLAVSLFPTRIDEGCNSEMPDSKFILKKEDITGYKDIIIAAQLLTTSQILYDGFISEPALAFSLLYNSNIPLDSKKELFSEIFKESKLPNGKLYALIGLYSIDKSLYFKFKKSLKKTEKIIFLSGCIEDEYSIGDILEKIEKKNLVHFILVSQSAIDANKPVISPSPRGLSNKPSRIDWTWLIKHVGTTE